MMINSKRTIAAALLVIGLLGTEATALRECAHAAQPAPLANQRQPAGVPLAGTVVDPGGKPLADAEVWLTTLLHDGKPGTLGKTKTDASGRFRLAVPDWWFQIPHSSRQELGLIAAKEGFRLGAICYSSSSIPPQSGLRLQVGTLASSAITVFAPDKTPLPKAKVRLESLLVDYIESGISEEHARTLAEINKYEFKVTPNGYVLGKGRVVLPEELSRRWTMTTDAQGKAEADRFPFADVTGVEIETERYGTQILSLYLRPLKSWSMIEIPKTFTLQPVGRLTGRVDAKNLEAVRGHVLRLTTHDWSKVDALISMGSALVKIAADGTFEVPALAEGQLQLRSSFEGTPNRVDSSFKLLPAIKAGESAQVTIPLRLGVTITGLVREKGTNRPIPGLVVLIGSGNVTTQVLTDPDGHYRCLVSPGPVYRIPGLPNEFSPLDRKQNGPVNVPNDIAEHETPILELERAPSVRGTVVDEAGKPIPGAVVQAGWWGYDHRMSRSSFREVTAICDDQGAFAIESVILRTDDVRGVAVAKETELRMTARNKDAVLEQPVVLRGDLSRPVTLKISKSYAVALSGKVVDATGQPVRDARVRIWHKPWTPPMVLRTPNPVVFAASTEIHTDAAGTFRSPQELERGEEYRAEIEGDGILSAKTGWLKVTDAKSDVFPDLAIQRTNALTGVVHDREGKPVANAKILRTDDGPLRLEAASDAQGKFRLANVPDGRGFLFTDAEGFRFYGALVPAGTKDVQVVLTRTTEAVARPLSTLPQTVSKEERRKLAKRVLEPLVQKFLDKGDDNGRFRALETLAKVDPPRVIDLLEKLRFKESHYDDGLRRQIALSLAPDGLEDAIGFVETMKDSFQRALTYVQLADSLPEAKRKVQIELLGQALVLGRADKEAAQRVIVLGQVADRLFKWNEKDRAAKVIEEGRKDAGNLPTAAWAGYARAVFAESLALFDLPAALELTKGLSDEMEFDRHHGNIAHKVAGMNPPEAERILGLVKGERSTVGLFYPPRICYRMAPVDLERARRIAEKTREPYYRAQAYGVMAQALAKTNPKEAEKLLQEAFTKLAAHAAVGEDRFDGFHDASSVAASLLPVVESIDPQLVTEFLWRAVALRHPPHEKATRRPTELEKLNAPGRDAALAMALARYDRDLARGFWKPNAQEAATNMQSGYGSAVVAAPLAIDPKEAVEFVESWPEGQGKDTARRILAELLMLDDGALLRDLIKRAGMWVIDTEDLF